MSPVIPGQHWHQTDGPELESEKWMGPQGIEGRVTRVARVENFKRQNRNRAAKNCSHILNKGGYWEKSGAAFPSSSLV